MFYFNLNGDLSYSQVNDHISFYSRDMGKAASMLKERGIPYITAVLPTIEIPQIFLHDPDNYMVSPVR